MIDLLYSLGNKILYILARKICGHSTGNKILKAIANNLIFAFRETDIIAILDGDEFSIIPYALENIESVEKSAKRVITLIPTPIIFGKDMLSADISIDIALHSSGDDDNLELLMRNADSALYNEKKAGRNTYCVHNTRDRLKRN